MENNNSALEPTSSLFSQAIEDCLHASYSGLIHVVAALFKQLEQRMENELILKLREHLVPLGLSPTSLNYGWNSEPDKQQLIDSLCQFAKDNCSVRTF